MRLYPDVKVQDEDEKELVQKRTDGKNRGKISDPWSSGEKSGCHMAGALYLVSERSKVERKSRRTFNGMVLQTSGGSIVGKRCKAALR